jgi:hypothetical protein
MKKKTKKKSELIRFRVDAIHALADRIATDILTVGGVDIDIECTRAQMMLKVGAGEKNMGGRCKISIIQCIEKRLHELEDK